METTINSLSNKIHSFLPYVYVFFIFCKTKIMMDLFVQVLMDVNQC